MRRILKYICAVAMAVTTCSCGPKDQEQKALGPEETVQAFYKAVSRGDFEAAAELRDRMIELKKHLLEIEGGK